ncbi:hypothetical protein L2725_06805 [Shewanella corallii]|uniref:Tetratricopeptide repeat protein n=1 Tax=Shewanella corallii TaxID=560080 RepID=A0ABT0N4V7_9GAMM|nr:hypothetical protein [Shewanella corallii]MCL2913498.1 hypothetical protein [Shewanella corallii]
MESWLKYTQTANLLFQEQEWKLAECWYRRALARACALYQFSPNEDKVVMAWIASFHNLAALFHQQGEPEAQRIHLLNPYENLFGRLTQDQSCCDLSLLLKGMDLCIREIQLYNSHSVTHPIHLLPLPSEEPCH